MEIIRSSDLSETLIDDSVFWPDSLKLIKPAGVDGFRHPETSRCPHIHVNEIKWPLELEDLCLDIKGITGLEICIQLHNLQILEYP